MSNPRPQTHALFGHHLITNTPQKAKGKALDCEYFKKCLTFWAKGFFTHWQFWRSIPLSCLDSRYTARASSWLKQQVCFLLKVTTSYHLHMKLLPFTVQKYYTVLLNSIAFISLFFLQLIWDISIRGKCYWCENYYFLFPNLPSWVEQSIQTPRSKERELPGRNKS